MSIRKSKSPLKRIVAFLVSVLLSAGLFSACTEGDGKSGGAVTPGNYDIWGVYNSVKVWQDTPASEYEADRLPARLDFEAAKNEYENAQLIITPEKDVKSYTAQITDLSGPGGAVIPASDITIYNQKYIYIYELNRPAARPFTTGWCPDALVPFENAAQKNENKIKAGENQGLYVTARTRKTTPAGLYTGNLSLVLDGNVRDIPVNFTVWDFTVPDEVHTQSAFNLFRPNLVSGELDTTLEIYEKYVDFFLDYRISTDFMPIEDGYDLDELLTQAKKYAADPRCSAYCLPYKAMVRQVTLLDPIDPSVPIKWITDIDHDLFRAQLEILARESTPTLNLLKKAYMYPYEATDEPQFSGAYDNVRYLSRKIREATIEVADELLSEDPNFFSSRNMEVTDLTKLQYLITVDSRDVINDYVPTFTPIFSNFYSAQSRQFFKDKQNNRYSSGTTWWYGCIDPYAPQPTYHLDDYLISSRILSWMQYDYGIQGNLYWGTATYNLAGNSGVPLNAYADPERTNMAGRAGTNGDGYLVYPGLDYGIYGPVPSLRLQSIRDGLEDYEYIWLYDQALSELNEQYGLNYKANDILQSLYTQLYNGTTPSVNSKTLADARRALASMIAEATKDARAIVNTVGIDPENTKASVEVYYDSSFTLKVGGVALAKTAVGTGGSRSVLDIPLIAQENYFEGTFEKDGASYDIRVLIGKKLTMLNRFETEADIEKLDVSRGNGEEPFDHIVKSLAAFDGKTAGKIDIAKADMGDPQLNLTYKPSVRFDKAAALDNVPLSDIDSLSLNVYNLGITPQTVRLVAYMGTSSYTLMTVTLGAMRWTTVRADQIYNAQWNNLANATRIDLQFDNNTSFARTFYIDSLYMTAR
jgi:hypothetical protein